MPDRPASRLHRWLIRRLLPRDFAARFHVDMGLAFREALDASESASQRIGLWVREVRDLSRTGRKLRRMERARPLGSRRQRLKRGGMTMWGLRDDLRYALRSLVRRPAFSAFAILTIGLGVGAATAIYSTVEGVLLRPVPYPGAERMVTLLRPIGNSGGMMTPVEEQVEAWREMDDIFEQIEPFTIHTMTVTGDGAPVEVTAGLIRPSFHDFVERAPRLGRTFTDDEMTDESRVILLSHGMWRQRFGASPDALGQSLELDGEQWTIIGVMPANTPGLGFGLSPVEIWRPMPRDTRGTVPTALLREGVTLEMADERLAVPIEAPQGEVTGMARGVVESIGLRIADTLRALMVAVLALLLIACLNVSNLLLSRANQRRRETAVRAALGSGRGRLARQMLAEGMLLGIAGGGLGIGLAWAGLEILLASTPASLDVLNGVSLNSRVVAFAFALTMGASLLFSTVPIWQATRRDRFDSLRDGARTEGQGVLGSRIRWGLVSAEVALSFALVVGATLVLGELGRLQQTDAGFDADRVLSLQVLLPTWEYGRGENAGPVFDGIQSRLSALPGVERVARGMGRPGSSGITFGALEIEGEKPSEDTEVLHGPPAGPGYFAALGQPIRGREFTADDIVEGAPKVLIIGEGTARKYFGTTDVVGQRIRFGDDDDGWQTVVGVAGDVAMTGLSSTEQALQLYYPLLPQYGAEAHFFLRAEAGVDPTTLIERAVAIARAEAPDARIDDVGLMSDLLAGTLARERFMSTLLGTFTSLALLLAAIGLYGVVSQLVGQRRKEIGIRMAMGAGTNSIRRMVLRYGAAATALGIAMGIGLTTLGLRYASSRIFGLEQAGFGAWFTAGLVLSGVSLAATWLPARQASRVDPVDAMRTE